MNHFIVDQERAALADTRRQNSVHGRHLLVLSPDAS